MKYIFVVGAPGSKWSSVVKNIYTSASLDTTDHSDERTYYHDASGQMLLMHQGAYWDPGMEFDLPADLTKLTKIELEAVFDSAFSGEGVRIIKSHIFCDNIDYLKAVWPDCPIVLVYRDDDACLGWWVKCGHFNITYPKYDKYYVDLKRMAFLIHRQNLGIIEADKKYPGKRVINNHELADTLGIAQPSKEYFQDYNKSDIKVRVI
jgi:hypothetical protein